MPQKKKRDGCPPALWMRRVAATKELERDPIVGYDDIAARFDTTIKAIRNLSTKLKYEYRRVPNPKGGTIKKFHINAFIKAVRRHVDNYKWL